uniref:Uncharacterized protein n=1 Tax=Oryza brachyantha TaxID=4533 RepID=J3MCI3_ORYBR
MAFHLAALRLISSPLPPPPPMSSSTWAATCSRRSSSSRRSPMPHSSHTYRELMYWSANPGQQIIGTPEQMLSVEEFHPLCVRNAPTARCRSTCSCAHHSAMKHRSLVSETKPSGNALMPPATRPGRTTQRNGRRLSARPHASSAILSGDITVRLPKLTYSTAPDGCASSHVMHAASSSQRLSPAAAPPCPFARSTTRPCMAAARGPMVYTRGNSSLSASSTSDSRSSNVLRMSPCALAQLFASSSSTRSAKLVGSNVRTKLETSPSRTVGMPAIQSIGVSR